MTTPIAVALQPGSIGNPPDLSEFFRTADIRIPGPWTSRLGFAYATEAGVDALDAATFPSPLWNAGAKQWVVGIHHGITEPAAVNRIASMPESEVRLFLGHRSIRDAIISPPHFHAKVIAINAGEQSHLHALWASSANLTGNALSPRARNFELGVSVIDRSTGLDSSAATELDLWWQDAWEESVPITSARLSQYADERESFVRRNPDAASEIEGPARDRVQNATTLWIEAGAMSGGSRNQIEFNRDLAAFFGDVASAPRHLPLAHSGNVWTDRPLSPKRTTYGVEIWRLSLPTETQSGLRYPGRVIRFEKQRVRRRTQFEVDVADPGTPTELRWREETRRRGYVGVTSGLRSFGLT